MKTKSLLATALLTLISSLLILNSPAAVPLSWTVETTRAQPATFEAYQGETLTFEAALQSRGKPLEAPLNYSFFWQTNGMGNAYWEAPCSRGGDIPVAASTNVLFATWLPAYDVGAKVYNCFIGSPSNIYHAAFQLRLRPSPGASPNTLPLPTPVIDFAKVRVLNPPWGGGGVDTNTVRDIVREQLATNGIRKVDGAARPLPKYLHLYEADDSYPAAAADYYAQRQGGGAVPAPQCSSVRSGGYLSRNFDFPFDDRAEFVVRVSSRGGDIPVAAKRFASVGVAQVGTNLTEQIVTSGQPSRWYKALPGATVDGINENGVVAEINVVDGDPHALDAWPTEGTIHCLGAVRWVLDNATNAASAAQGVAAEVYFPAGWTQNYHWMIADERETWIVENGEAHQVTNRAVMTNFRLYPKTYGAGWERYMLLEDSFANITNAWYTRAYERDTEWVSEFRDLAEMEAAKTAWETHAREQLRGHGLWQSVHTSVYDISNRTLRVAVQEVDDWYTFQVPSAGGVKVEVDPTVPAWAKEPTPPQTMTTNAVERIANAAVTTNVLVAATTNRVAALETATNNLTSSVSSLQSSKVDKVKNPAPVVDNLAALTADGGIKNSGIAKTDVATMNDLESKVSTNDFVTATNNLTTSIGEVGETANNAQQAAANAQQSASSASASVNQLAGQVGTIGAHLNAEDARFVSTNYNSETRMPEAYVEIKLPDNSWAVIWREMTRWNWLLDDYLPQHYYTKSQVDAALDQKADRAWGYYDSHSGTYAPDGYTWLSSPKVALAAGLGYQRTVTAEGAIWVLESNGLVTETGGVASNGFFRISDDEGNVHFEIVKGNKRTIGADASSCQVVAGFSPTKLQIGYSVISDAHPTLRICNNLNTQQWKDETDPDCLANVTWDGQSGAWVAYVQGKAAQSALFVKATYETGAESYIRNVAPVSMEFMYLGGQKFAVGTATISGHTVLTLTPAN